jgi:hypothetical protein
MKRYKLLKDLPTFKAGDKFYLDSNNNLRLSGSEIIAYSHITLEKFPNILKDWFEEITEYKRWRAERGGAYYYIYNSGQIDFSCDYGDMKSDYLYKIGNYFKTEEEVKAYKEYLIARQVLLDDAEGGKFVSDHKNIYTIYDCETKELNQTITTYSYIPGAIIFHNNADLEKSLEEHKEQWEIVRKYEMGE